MLAFVTNAISAVLQRKMVRNVAAHAGVRVTSAPRPPARPRRSTRHPFQAPARRPSVLERHVFRPGPAAYGDCLVLGRRI